jgi:hypothetical protein
MLAAMTVGSPHHLTPTQRRVMFMACDRGIRPKDVGTLVRVTTLNSLEVRGLIHLRTSRKGRRSWRATDAGRGLIASSGLRSTFMHKRSEYAYTHTRTHAMLREHEVIL